MLCCSSGDTTEKQGTAEERQKARTNVIAVNDPSSRQRLDVGEGASTDGERHEEKRS